MTCGVHVKVKDSFSGAASLLLLGIIQVLGLSDLMASAFTSEPSFEYHNKLDCPENGTLSVD